MTQQRDQRSCRLAATTRAPSPPRSEVRIRRLTSATARSPTLPSDPPQVRSGHILRTTFSNRASQVSRRPIQRQQRSTAQSAPKKRPFCHHGRPRSEDLRPPLPPDRRGCCRRSFSGLRISTPRSCPAVSSFRRIVTVVSISSRLVLLPRVVPSAPMSRSNRALDCTCSPRRVPTSVAYVGSCVEQMPREER